MSTNGSLLVTVCSKMDRRKVLRAAEVVAGNCDQGLFPSVERTVGKLHCPESLVPQVYPKSEEQHTLERELK